MPEHEETTQGGTEARATIRYLRYSAQKGRLVADLIRGRDVDEAAAILEACPKRAAVWTLKLLKSAKANAQNTKDMRPESLYVKSVYVDEGPTMKRIMTRARGRADRRFRRTCHTTIVLEERS